MARAPQRPQSVELLRPAASPVDTFVAPGPNRLMELAQSLSPLDREVRNLIETRTQRGIEEDRKKAEAAEALSNGEGYAEGVRTGRIPANMSNHFMRAYKNAEGRTIGRRLQSQYQAAWTSWDGKNQEDPDGSLHATFMKDFLRSNVGTEDPDVLAGLLPALRGLQETAAAQDMKYRSDRAYEGSLTAHSSRVNQVIDDGDDAGLLSPNGTDYAGVYSAALAERARIVASGARPEDFDKAMMEAFAAKALEKRDAGLLGWFDQTVPGQTYTYGDTPEGQALRLQTIERLETARRQYASDEHTRQTREDEAAKDAATRTVVDLLASGEAIPEELLQAGQRVDPTFRVRIAEWRKNLQERTTDPVILDAIYGEILSGGGVRAVVEAFNAGAIANPDDLTKLHTFAKGFEDSKDRIEAALGGATARGILGTIDVRTKGSTTLGDPVGGLSNAGLAAQRDFRKMVMEWVITNPDASSLEREDAVDRIGRTILNAIGQPSVLREGGDYARPDDLSGSNPHADVPAWPAPRAVAPSQQEAPKPEPESSWSLDPRTWFGSDGESESETPANTSPDRAWFDGLPEESRAMIESFARDNGITVEEAIRGAKAAKQGGGAQSEPEATVQPMSYNPADDPANIQPDYAFLQSRARGGAQRPDSFSGMRPEFASGITAMFKAAPPEIAEGLEVFSGYRSPEKQAELWKAALKKYGSAAAARKWVAPPGRSGHNHGHAADLQWNGQRIDRAPANVRKWLHDNAGQFGLAFPLSNEAWHVELAGARSGGAGNAPAARREFTTADAEAFLAAAMVEDPLDTVGSEDDGEGAFVSGDQTAGRILDLIGEHEAAGNYNAVFGNAASKADLGSLTLDQIIEQQTRALKRGVRSSAIGKYQFLRKTLRSLKSDMGLTGSELFDRKLQDRLAMGLLERRGYSAYRAGRITRKQFALRLSQEWASLPNPSTGRSYYAGDGFHGGTNAKTRDVYAAMGFGI